MGIIYKLKPEIKDYVLEEKKEKPILSCRGLVALVEKKFQVSISKSSINSIIKEAGLSMPVGRRIRKRRRKVVIPILSQLQIESKLIETPLIERYEQAKEPLHAPTEILVEETMKETPVEEMPERPVEPLIELPPEEPPEVEELPLDSEIECTGAILLKAVDCLIGGSSKIVETIKNLLHKEEKHLLSKTESLIYLSLFNITEENGLRGLWTMVNKKISQETIMRYLTILQEVKELPSNILGIISNLFQEVRGIKLSLSDASAFYVDGQLHTVWSTPQIPYDFSTTLYNINSYINRYFKESASILLFMAPGYDTPSKEFFDFLLSLDGIEKSISKLILYDHKFNEIDIISLGPVKKHSFIFGLWPWQFGQYRKGKLKGEFRKFYFAPLKKDFYLTDIEVELSQPIINKKVTLTGCALKTNLQEKIKLILLTNLGQTKSAEELANLYLSHWPNLEEGFQDFSRKIELFTYTANSQRFFSLESQSLVQNASDITIVLKHYIKALDAYLRWHVFPLGYENKDFYTTNERFYQLKVCLKKEQDCLFLTFKPPVKYPFLKDLVYACNRINEREIVFPDGKRLWLSV